MKTARGFSCTSAAQRIRIDFVIALECDLVDDGIFNDRHNRGRADEIDAHVLEEARRKQRLDRTVDLAAIESVANRELKIGAHRLGLDAAIALDVDVSHDLRMCGLSECNTVEENERRRGYC